VSALPAPTPRRIAADRYRSQHFHELERERLWTRVWQLACTEDCVPESGDYYEYRCGALSILLLRDETGALRAFQNACRHRGAALVDGSGSGLAQLRCRYHGWCYDLRGHLRKVSDDGLGAGQPGPLSLVPVQVASWEGLVFVNPDPAAEPLADFLEVLPRELAWVKLGEYSCPQVFSVPLRCNWKVVVDAFIETYHLHVVHPQMLAIADDVNTPITLFDKHTMFEQPYGVPSPRLEAPDDATLWQEFARNLGHRLGRAFASDEPLPPPPEVPPGQTLKQVLTRMIREHLRGLGDLYPAISDDQAIHDYHYHVFPNAVFNVFAGWYGFIRARPGPTPNRCWLDMWNFDLLPPGHPKRHARPLEQVLQPHEVGPLGLVVKQDVDNFEVLQRGLEQPGLRELRLVPAEARIGRMHEILDRYLGTDCRGELASEP
jgi:phenylpropionate dioxygenase-like ring-hydroxylating dioxygenase large terminal subunit